MTLTLGSGPFSGTTSGTFNFERTGPEHVLYWEDSLPRVRAVVAGETVLDSRRTKLLHETGALPVRYIPRDDVRTDLLEPSSKTAHSPAKGDASFWHIRVGDVLLEDAVWGYPEPVEGAPPMADHLAVQFDRPDAWYEEDELVYAHPRDPYHRVDVRAGSYHVVVRCGGEVVAESDRPKLLFETGLPIRWYLTPADVRTELLTKSETVSDCPYKGPGQHWHLSVGGTRVDDAAWSLPFPLPEGLGAGQHLCFYPDKVELEVDGERITD